ncbi:MAG: D-alanine--D-alanine ligase [Fibrobacterales bacterium]
MPKKIAVLIGGPSLEYDVSLVSGSEVVRNLNQSKYSVLPIWINRDGKWHWPSGPFSAEECEHFSIDHFSSRLDLCTATPPSLSELPVIDCAFLALHGAFGEDGKVQKLMEILEIPYTGSGVTASAQTLNKISTKKIYQEALIPTPSWGVIEKSQFRPSDIGVIIQQIPLPLVIKNPLGGSSIGIGIAKNEAEALEVIERLFTDTNELLVEEFISGREGTSAYLEGKNPLPVTEIIPDTEFFDFEAKYQGKSKEITPGKFSPQVTKKMQMFSEKSHKALGMEVYSRTDFMIIDDQVLALETNSLPGLTAQSLLPQAAKYAGLSFSQLLDTIIEESFKK